MYTKESSMKQVLQNERGMALALAIVALVVVGALVAGAFFSGTQEQRVAENVRRVQESFGVTEEGVSDIINHWQDSVGVYNILWNYPSGTAAGAAGSPASAKALTRKTALSRTGSYSGTLYKMNDAMYLIDMTGQDTMSLAGRIRGGGASQRVGLLARIRPLQVDVRASLTSGRGNVVLGNSVINGNDQIPANWGNCGPLDAPKAGIRVDQGSSVSSGGSSMVMGSPPVLTDSNVTDSTFSKFGDVTYPQLTQRASVILPGGNTWTNIAPVVTNGQCDKTQITNWGDGVTPTQPCGGYFPIIWIQGDAHINGNQGQGILLVDGTLTVQGSFQFFGITMIQGKLITAGGGATDAHFYGAVLAHDSVQVGNNQISGNANLNYSNCAILRALNNTGIASTMRSRGWVQLF